MSAENWIDILNRAIQMNAAWEVEDDESGNTFMYDVEVLNDIVTLLENGATSDEVVHQYEQYVGPDFERYILVLEQAMEQTEEDEPDVLDADAPTVDDAVSAGNDTPSSFDYGDVPEEPSEQENKKDSPNKAPKSKKGLVIGVSLAGLITMVGVGGFVFYSAFTQTSSPVAQQKTVTPVLKSTPKPPVKDEAPQQAAVTNNQTGSSNTAEHGTVSGSQSKGFTVAQMGTEQTSRGSEVSQSTAPTSSQAQPAPRQQQAPMPSPSAIVDDSQLADMRDEINAQIEKIEASMSEKIGDRFGDLRETLGRMEAQLKRIDDLEKKIAQERNEEEKISETVKKKVQGLTRLGEFSILANAGVKNRVVALSPTNKVITLEEGERNILAAGSNLTVEEIVGNGDAVIFSNGWFIDHVRAPESLREKRLTENSETASNTDVGTQDAPSVPRTAAISKSLNPAMVAASSRNNSSADNRFPTIQRAPQGWEATALIPPRRAVIVDPEGNSITITPGSQIAGLGEVHSVKQDRVLAGQFYIPLSNL